MTQIDARTVVTLALAQGYGELPRDVAERIAAGADRAVAAVRASLAETLFESEPAQFLPLLEALARDENAS